VLRLGTMHQSIKVDNRFATVYDTARTLGVSKSRTEDLIRRVRQITDRIASTSRTGEFTTTPTRKKTVRTAAKKVSGRHAGTSAKKTKAKAKSARA
jgi:hypothetical protein